MSLDKALSNREQNLNKFCAHLDKDIDKLAEGAKDIKDQAQVCNTLYHWCTICTVLRILSYWMPTRSLPKCKNFLAIY